MKEKHFFQTDLNSQLPQNFVSLLRLVMACVLLSLSLFVIMVSLILRPILLKQAVRNAEQSLDFVDTELSDMQMSAKSTAAYTLLSESCIPLLNATSQNMLNASTITSGLRQLRLFVSSNSKIDSLVIMNRKAGYIFSTQAVPIISDTGDEAIFPEWMVSNMAGTFFRYAIENGTDGKALSSAHDVYTYVAPNIYENGTLQSAVVVNLSLEYLKNRIASSFDQSVSVLQITDGQDTIIQFGTDDFFADEAASRAIAEMSDKLLHTSEQTILGERWLLVNQTSDSNGIQLSAAYKCSSIYHTADQIQRIVIGIFFVVLLLGVILSVAATVFVHSKIETRGKTDKTLACQKFWLDYITARVQYARDELDGKIHDLHMGDCCQGQMLLMHLVPDNKTDDVVVRNAGAEMVNLFLQVFQSFSPVLLFSFRDDYLFLLREQTMEAPNAANASMLLQQFQEESVSHFKLLGSDASAELENYPELWEEFALTLPQLFFYPIDTWQTLSVITEEHTDHSLKRNSELFHCIPLAVANGDTTMACELFAQFELSLRKKTYESYFNCITQLILNIADQLLQKQALRLTDVDNDLMFDVFCSAAKSCKSVSAICVLVQRYLTDAAAYFSEIAKSPQEKGKVGNICDFIRENFKNSQLTNIEIAEEFKISPDYLRKIFKAETGKSISEYISFVRLSAAAEMIESSQRPLGEIAADCGFSNVNYFYTCFKKAYGVTPKAYRALSQKDNAADSGIKNDEAERIL